MRTASGHTLVWRFENSAPAAALAPGNFWEEITIAAKTFEERNEALIQRSLGNRANITVCVHGINKNYCTPCNTKKAPKAAKAKKAKPETAEAKPSPSAE